MYRVQQECIVRSVCSVLCIFMDRYRAQRLNFAVYAVVVNRARIVEVSSGCGALPLRVIMRAIAPAWHRPEVMAVLYFDYE